VGIGRIETVPEGLTRIFTDQRDQEQATATAGPFDRLRAGSSTALLTTCVGNYAQDDSVGGGHGKAGRRATAEADSSAALRNDNRERANARTNS
jgi:hypothetical protein